MAAGEDDGFREGLNPSYALQLMGIASCPAKAGHPVRRAFSEFS
jgi:hypothetical protein